MLTVLVLPAVFVVNLFQSFCISQNLNLDFTPWGKFAEETQLWGEVAKKSITPVISNRSGNKDGLPRGRACSSAALPLMSKQGSVRRHVSVSGKLSSSAPHYPGTLSGTELMPPGIIQGEKSSYSLLCFLGVLALEYGIEKIKCYSKNLRILTLLHSLTVNYLMV